MAAITRAEARRQIVAFARRRIKSDEGSALCVSVIFGANTLIASGGERPLVLKAQREVEDALAKCRPSGVRMFWWNLDAEGQKKRLAVCRKLARQFAKKKRTPTMRRSA